MSQPMKYRTAQLRRSVRLIASNDRRQRKRVWRIYRQINRTNILNLNRSLSALGVAAREAGSKIKAAFETMNNLGKVKS